LFLHELLNQERLDGSSGVATACINHGVDIGLYLAGAI
jgi:hypothetical protein